MMAAARAIQAKPKMSRRRAGEVPVIDARDAVSVSKAKAKAAPTIGFGCPPLSDWPHHVVVSIPPGRGGDITISENHGILGHANGSEEVERCLVPRVRWNAMADAAKAELNLRLRDKELLTGRWQPGDNRVDRILGTELLTLAWAIVAADEQDVPAVVSAWVALQPSERLWLAGRVLANPAVQNVRRGIALLLSGGPVVSDPRSKRRTAGATGSKGLATLPLFDLG